MCIVHVCSVNADIQKMFKSTKLFSLDTSEKKLKGQWENAHQIRQVNELPYWKIGAFKGQWKRSHKIRQGKELPYKKYDMDVERLHVNRSEHKFVAMSAVWGE